MSRRTIRSSHLRILAMAGSLAAAPAFGQGTLTASYQRAEAVAEYSPGAPAFGNFGSTTDVTGIDFYAIEDRRYGRDGFVGHGYAERGATFSPSSPMIGGNFSKVVLDACTSAQISQSKIGPHAWENAYGLADGYVDFTLNTQVGWTWIGGWQGQSYSTGAYNGVFGKMSLQDLSTGFYYVNETRQSIDAVGDWVEFFSLGGTLNPGSYRLSWSHASQVLGGNTSLGFFPTGKGGSELISCINSTFEVFVPAPGALALLGFSGLFASRRRR